MSEHEHGPSSAAGDEPRSESQSAAQGADGTPAPDAPAVTEDQVKSALRRVKDPELNLNIIDLGLVYAINVEGRKITLDMSLTSPACPSGPEIMMQAEQQLRALPGVEDVEINLVWSPFWTPDRIEPRIRAYLGI